MITAICFIILSLGIILAGYFSGLETGAYCLNRVRLRMRAEEGQPSARILESIIGEPQLFVIAVLIGTNASIYLATAAVTQLGTIRQWHHPDLLATLILSPILLVFAEAIPKNIFRRNADTLLYKVARSTKLVLIPIWPLARLFARVIPVPGGGTRDWAERFFSRQRLRFLLLESSEEGVLTPYQRTIANNILSLRGLRVISVMVPLPRVVALEESADEEEVVEVLARSRYSRFPVYREHKWNIVGIFNVLDFLAHGEFAVKRHVREVPTLFPWTTVGAALHRLRVVHKPMGIVIDTRGRALGLVTVKDLVEEIVGELREW